MSDPNGGHWEGDIPEVRSGEIDNLERQMKRIKENIKSEQEKQIAALRAEIAEAVELLRRHEEQFAGVDDILGERYCIFCGRHDEDFAVVGQPHEATCRLAAFLAKHTTQEKDDDNDK